MEDTPYTVPLPLRENSEEGNAIPPPNLDQPPIIFGYTTLFCAVSFMLWFAYNAYVCVREKVMVFHTASPILSSRLHLVFWAAVSPQLLFFCAYASWLGWKFFKHNWSSHVGWCTTTSYERKKKKTTERTQCLEASTEAPSRNLVINYWLNYFLACAFMCVSLPCFFGCSS